MTVYGATNRYQNINQQPQSNVHPDFENNKKLGELFFQKYDQVHHLTLGEYDPITQDIIKVSNDAICTTMCYIPAKISNRSNICAVISYNQPAKDFSDMCFNAHEKIYKNQGTITGKL